MHGSANPELRYVLALCNHLRECGDEFLCFFDANTDHLLRERSSEQSAVFQQIIRDPRWSGNLRVVPGGTEADEWILSSAKSEGAEVISNEKYRDRARDNRWIWKRRHPLRGTRQTTILETLGMEVPVLPSAVDYL